MAAIEITGLTKDYHSGFWRKRPWRALDGLSLTVEQGEIFGFLGHNGAGKTTTLKLLTGLIFPTAGGATILDQPIGKPETFQHLGYLPENPYFYDYLTAQELLDYFARFYPMTATEAKRRRDSVLDEVGLSAFRNLPLRKFSKGMLQRLGIAQAVLHHPDVVLLDEPMSGLDPLGRRDVRELISRMKREQKTVFFSTHILADAEALCDRVAVLNRGKLVGVGRISELLTPRLGLGRETPIEAIVECTPACTGALLGGVLKLSTKPPQLSGGQYRVEISERAIQPLLALCQKDGLRLISLNPLHRSLEDYFADLSHPAGSGSPQAGRSEP
jgi:ABC-2 type transport system ATP-binding protein